LGVGAPGGATGAGALGSLERTTTDPELLSDLADRLNRIHEPVQHHGDLVPVRAQTLVLLAQLLELSAEIGHLFA
jgi:hypothetical protein